MQPVVERQKGIHPSDPRFFQTFYHGLLDLFAYSTGSNTIWFGSFQHEPTIDRVFQLTRFSGFSGSNGGPAQSWRGFHC